MNIFIYCNLRCLACEGLLVYTFPAACWQDRCRLQHLWFRTPLPQPLDQRRGEATLHLWRWRHRGPCSRKCARIRHRSGGLPSWSSRPSPGGDKLNRNPSIWKSIISHQARSLINMFTYILVRELIRPCLMLNALMSKIIHLCSVEKIKNTEYNRAPFLGRLRWN